MRGSGSAAVFLGALLFELALAGLALALGALANQPLLSLIRPRFAMVALAVVATLPLLGLYAWVLRSGWPPIVGLRGVMEKTLRPTFGQWSILQLALISAAAGFGEELLFRGFLQPWLERSLPPWGALVVASIAFGLVHPLSVVYGIVVGSIGLYLGWLWMASGDLLVPMVAHGLYDFVALVWFCRAGLPGRPAAGKTSS